MANRAVFLDRDGTMAPDVHYCSRIEDFSLFPGSAKAVKRLNEKGFKVVVITNQSGIARGFFTAETLSDIHKKMIRLLAEEGAMIDGLYYCPHHPDDNCECRKPKTKLIIQAANEFDVDLRQSFVVGDLPLDIELGKRVGCKTVLIGTDGKGCNPDAITPSLLDASAIIIDQWHSLK